MPTPRSPTLLALSFLASLAVSASDPAPAAAGQAREEGVLVVGRVSNNPRKDYPALKALADHLAAGLRDVGVEGSRVQFADDSGTMVDLLRRGDIDLVFDTVFPSLAYEREAGAKLLLREWRDGSPTYRSVLFKRKDTPLGGLPDLVGRTVAFERPGSTSAYFVPRAELVAAGLRLHELKGTDVPPPDGAVGYVFAGSENNLVVWVHRRLVAAGAFSDIDWDQSEDMPPALKQDLEIFHRSAPLPRALVVARPGLPPATEERIRRILLAADRDPVGARVLAGKRVARYDELAGEAADGVAAARRLIAFGS